MAAQQREHGFDHLRAVSCLFIILLHTVSSTTLMYSIRLNSFLRAAGFQAVTDELMWAVPCFVMVTGALLLPPEKHIGYRALFTKYIARMVKAIVVFGVLFVALEMIFNPDQRTWAHVGGGLYEIFSGGGWSHMWYLYCLLGLYLLLPAYKKVTALAGERDILYLLAVYGLFEALAPLLGIWNIRCGFYIHVSTVYPFWLFLGYWLHRWGKRFSRALYGWVFLGATAVIAGASLARTYWRLDGLSALFTYSSPLVILQAGGLAGWFFQSRADGSGAVSRFLTNIDRHSFGVYLIHMAYIRLLYKHLHFDPFSIGAVPGVLAVALAAFVLAYGTEWVLRKLPLFKSIL